MHNDKKLKQIAKQTPKDSIANIKSKPTSIISKGTHAYACICIIMYCKQWVLETCRKN